MADWVTISALATAGGTLVLAGATFASVKSANRAARVAERALLAGLRPVLMPSRFDDPPQKISFADQKWLKVRGGGAAAEVSEEAIYLAMPLRNAGSGIAVLHGWIFHPAAVLRESSPPPPEAFTRLTRDLYIPVGDIGFWQGTFRDPAAPEFAEASAAISAGEPSTVDLLYGDHEGTQRVISRFALFPREDGDGWLAVVARHWNVDRDDPR